MQENQNGLTMTFVERSAQLSALESTRENGLSTDIAPTLMEIGNIALHTPAKQSTATNVERPTHVITMGKSTSGAIPTRGTGKSVAL